MQKKLHLYCIRLKCHGDWWESGQIQIFTGQWLMGHSPCKYVKDVCLILKRKFHTGIMVTSLQSMLNMRRSTATILGWFLYLLNFLATHSCWFYAYWKSRIPILADFMPTNTQIIRSCFIPISEIYHSCYVPNRIVLVSL